MNIAVCFQCDRNSDKGATQPAQKLKKKYQKIYLFKRTDQYSSQDISLKIAGVSTGLFGGFFVASIG